MAKRRKSGEGTARLRKDGRWEGRIVVGYDDRGLPKTKSVLTKIKTECVERLEALKEELGEYASKTTPDTRPQKPPREKFEPRRGKYRRQGTGSIHQVSKNVWEGRYSPNINGKRIIRNVYASSIEECEQKLAEPIEEMNAEIAEMKTTIHA